MSVQPGKIASLAAFLVSSSTMFLTGCLAIALVTPFVKSGILRRHLSAMQTQNGDRRHTLSQLEHLDPVINPYRNLTLESQQLRVIAYAGLGQHELAAAAAARIHVLISDPAATAPKREKLAWHRLPEAWANRIYNRYTGDSLQVNPWSGFSRLADYYRANDDRDALRHLRSYLNANHPDHPFRRPTTENRNSGLRAAPENPAAHDARSSAASALPAASHVQNALSAERVPTDAARRRLQELDTRKADLMRELQTAGPNRRSEISDQIRRLRYEEFRLQQSASGIVETLDSPHLADAAPLTPRPSRRP